jgi:hypothetical protein
LFQFAAVETWLLASVTWLSSVVLLVILKGSFARRPCDESAIFTSSRSPRIGCSANSPSSRIDLENGRLVSGVGRRDGELVGLFVGQAADGRFDLGDGDLPEGGSPRRSLRR